MSKIIIKILTVLQTVCILLILPSPIVMVIVKLFTTYSVLPIIKVVIGLIACSIGLSYTAKIIDEID
jgi:hypothetical protein